MAYSVVPLVAVGDLWTAANQNTYLKDNMAAIWVGAAAGDMDYYTGAANKSRLPIGAGGGLLTEDGTDPSWLGIGTAGQGLRTNVGGTAPEWGWPLLDWGSRTTASYDSGAVAAWYTVTNSDITLTLPVDGLVFCWAQGSINSSAGGDAFVAVRIDGTEGVGVVCEEITDWIPFNCMNVKACLAGNIECDIRCYAEGASVAKIYTPYIMGLAFAGS